MYLSNIPVINIATKLNTTPEKIRKELKHQNIYKKEKGSDKIAQYDLESKLLKIWENAHQAEVLSKGKFTSGHIRKCCKNIQKTHKKYIWKYVTRNNAKNEK